MRKTLYLVLCTLFLVCFVGSFSAEAVDGIATGTEDKLGTVEQVLDDGKANEHKLTSSNPGTSSFTATADCEITVTSYLSTEGEAELGVDVNGEEVVSWQRMNDKDTSRLVVNGEVLEESNQEVKPGDFSPVEQKTKIKVKKGDKVTLKLAGNFGKFESHLSVTGVGVVENNNDQNNDNNGNADNPPPSNEAGYSNQKTFESYGVRNGGRQAWRISGNGPSFGKRIKFVFSDGYTVVVTNTSQRLGKGDGFVYRPGIGDRDTTNTGTAHNGIYIQAPFGNLSQKVTMYY